MVDKKTKANAVSLVGAAIRTGTLTKQEYCSYCYHNGAEHPIEAHHPDYSKPLNVVWLCRLCHRARHSVPYDALGYSPLQKWRLFKHLSISACAKLTGIPEHQWRTAETTGHMTNQLRRYFLDHYDKLLDEMERYHAHWFVHMTDKMCDKKKIAA